MLASCAIVAARLVGSGFPLPYLFPVVSDVLRDLRTGREVSLQLLLILACSKRGTMSSAEYISQRTRTKVEDSKPACIPSTLPRDLLFELLNLLAVRLGLDLLLADVRLSGGYAGTVVGDSYAA